MEILIGIVSGIIILFISAIIMRLAGLILKYALKFIVATTYIIACFVLGFMASKNGFSIKDVLSNSVILSVFAFPIGLTVAGYMVAIEYDETKAKIEILESQVKKMETLIKNLESKSKV